ncbi:long-chain acyl-CoA synthetase [Pedobacter sp. UYP30]|uniref:AMP-dependent synthetase/ligase n=1 Tax=Pedobacter sp. UYP30 TaxID=1756400 RepID=UPI003396FFAF
MDKNVTRVFDLLKYSLDKPKTEFVSGKVAGKWVNYSTDYFCKTVDNLSRGLVKMGIGKGGRVAVMSHNRPEWNIADFAANQLGAYQIPLYPTLSGHDIEFILRDAEISIIFVSSEELYTKLQPCVAKVNPEIKIFTFDSFQNANHWSTLLEEGEKSSGINLEEYHAAITPDDLLTIIYTSGTTGTPKGVMLTHNNLVSNFKNSAIILPPNLEKGLSFLPLSHIFERMIIYLYIYVRIDVYYAESMETIVADIQHVKPQVFSTVPRLLEKVYDKILEKGKELKGLKKQIFFWALKLAENFDLNSSAWYNFRLNIARKLVFKKWQAALGGNIGVIISGGAALNSRLARIFWAAGMSVFEGYGLTETSPVITVNHLTGIMFGTVGELIKGAELKIAEDGEILVRGDNVMKGYYNRPDLTAKEIDVEGWFHTGDIGELIDGRFLKITDRKKEMFKTAGGKYVAPQILENKYKESSFIEQIMVLGENRKFPSALIVPNFGILKKWATKHNLIYSSELELIKNPNVETKIQEEIDRFGADFGKWERVKRFALLATEWSIDGGELTPKLSLKRKVINEKNEVLINKIYTDAESFKPQH